MPHKFIERARWKRTGKMLAFYWKNNNQLITAINENRCKFTSNILMFIWIPGMWISIDRKMNDHVKLNREDWSGID